MDYNRLLRLEREYLKAYQQHQKHKTVVAALELARAERQLENYRGKQ